ncbi:MAG TPA: phosphoribosylformylglycinamidine synthase II, partial [Brachybacterium massiliense]|nr:phosphoribosylformylglycinamidine synthase II [Brachybacterium massiliense]
AVPLAITDCLNFGSPEDPGPMWQLVEAIGGLAEACETLEVPVTGGNVSLYNSTGEPGLIDSAIHPTPVVGVLGVFDDVARRVPSGWQGEGESVLLLGTTREELSGSAWADVAHQHLGGLPPRADLEAERALATVLIGSAAEQLGSAAHDLSEGGLAQALVEAVARFGVGAQISLTALTERDGVDAATALFSESQARALVAVPAEHEERLTALAAEHGVPVLRLGTTGGNALEIDGVGSFAVGELRDLREGTLPRYFG